MIKADSNSPLIWALSQRKCADGAFFSFRDGGAPYLHIVELKSTISLAAWAHAVDQFEGMFLTSLAVGRLLLIDKPAGITCYLAFSKERISGGAESASPTLLKAPVGKARTFGGLEAWEKGVMPLPLSFQAKLVKCVKDAGGVANFGSVN